MLWFTIKIYKCCAVSLEMFTLACYSIFIQKSNILISVNIKHTH